MREGLAKDSRFSALEFSFDSGGLVRGALNEGDSSPINIQLIGKKQDVLFAIADKIKKAVQAIDGVVDARVIQRPNAPELTIVVDRAKAAELGLTQDDIMKSVIAATNSSITYNKKNFWIDPKNGMQYFVGVQYPETKFETKQDILNIPDHRAPQKTPIPLGNVASFVETEIPTEVHHVNLQPAIDLTHERGRAATWATSAMTLPRSWPSSARTSATAPGFPTIRSRRAKAILEGAKIRLTGEYTRMQDTFRNLGRG